MHLRPAACTAIRDTSELKTSDEGLVSKKASSSTNTPSNILQNMQETGDTSSCWRVTQKQTNDSTKEDSMAALHVTGSSDGSPSSFQLGSFRGAALMTHSLLFLHVLLLGEGGLGSGQKFEMLFLFRFSHTFACKAASLCLSLTQSLFVCGKASL